MFCKDAMFKKIHKKSLLQLLRSSMGYHLANSVHATTYQPHKIVQNMRFELLRSWNCFQNPTSTNIDITSVPSLLVGQLGHLRVTFLVHLRYLQKPPHQHWLVECSWMEGLPSSLWQDQILPLSLVPGATAAYFFQKGCATKTDVNVVW